MASTSTSKSNPAVSAAQYKLAQAVLSGTARGKGMPVKVAREIVEKTPERMRSKFMKNAGTRGPIHAATSTIGGVTKYITSPVIKGVDYLDRGLGKAIKGNPAMRFTGKDGEKAARQYARLLQGEGKKARAEKSWGEGWQVVMVEGNPYNRQEAIENFAKQFAKARRGYGYGTTIQSARARIKRWTADGTHQEDLKFYEEAVDYYERHVKGRKSNPESDAASMYESFHGRASEEIAEYIEEEHYHGHLAELGQLIELKVRTVTGLDATFNFDYQGKPEKGVILASNESGTSLYFVGGDQSLPLKDIKMNTEEWEKDSMVIGDAYFVSYYTEKDFDSWEPIIYEHELGEETGDLPTLRYDKLNERLYLDGGAYIIKKPLFETSPGIEN